LARRPWKATQFYQNGSLWPRFADVGAGRVEGTQLNQTPTNEPRPRVEIVQLL